MQLLSLFGFFLGLMYTISIIGKVFYRAGVTTGSILLASLGWTLFAAQWIL